VVINVHNQVLSMQIFPLRKEGLVERLKNVNGTICAADFGTSREPIECKEPIWVLS
jgi:hypothetical protein